MMRADSHASIAAMKFWKSTSPKMLLLVALMLGLLGLLATLQYRWLGQVSRGERERMQVAVRAGATRFSQDFNREVTRAYLNFQMDASMLQEKDWQGYAERFERWNRQAPFPQLVSEVYTAERDEHKQVRLSRFNRAEKKFEPVEWPQEFAGVRPRLEKGLLQDSMEPEALREISLDPVAPEVPALISPVIAAPQVFIEGKAKVRLTEKMPEPLAEESSPLAGYLVIRLDPEVIKQELIPALAQRYFSASDGLEYNLEVINPQEPEKAIYQSAPTTAQGKFSGGDATAQLLDVQLDQFDTLFFGLPRRPATTDENKTVFTRKLPPGEFIMRKEEQSGDGSSRSSSVTHVRVFNRQMSGNGSAEQPAGSGRWQLLIQHRAGSLDAAVTSARNRNLAISFGILLLLAGSVAMIVISTRRAERLAHRQMEFVSAVSHEFRTPLAVIRSAGENLADGIIDAPQQIEKYGELIRNEGRRLTEMVEQVLEFAGARSGRNSYELRPVEVETLIEDALVSCQPLIMEKDFIVEKEIQSGLPLIGADAAALRRSLQNLLSNALKYDKENRRIEVRARSVINAGGEEVQITVEDQGIGIAPEELSNIFEPFYRGREVVAAQIHGNGLGLSLVKQVVEAHHGKVSVVSAPGQGSAFTLHLPALNQSSESNGAAQI